MDLWSDCHYEVFIAHTARGWKLRVSNAFCPSTFFSISMLLEVKPKAHGPGIEGLARKQQSEEEE